jgi:hypothetical protein
MILLLLALVALSTTSIFKIPGGSLELPAGCQAPDVLIGIDSSVGFIGCGQGKAVIRFSDFAMGSNVCPQIDRISLQSRFGAPFQVCGLWPKSADGTLQTMAVDLGLGALTMEIKSPDDVLLLMQIASSLRVDRKQ